jgi:TonB family protein
LKALTQTRKRLTSARNEAERGFERKRLVYTISRSDPAPFGKLRFLMHLKTDHICCITILLFSVLAASGQTQPADNADVGKAAPTTVFKIGPGVIPPRVTHAPSPSYSGEALAAHYEGTCVLWLIVGPDGSPHDIRVARSLGMGLDEKAIEAVRNWRFEPAQKDGKPIAVQINVEVAFRFHGKENKKILKLEEKANAGDARAELELSTNYFEGRDVPKSEVRGLELLQRAANRGLARAQFLMGEHYAHDGASADYVSAYMWCELARRGGYEDGDKLLRELASKMSPEQLSDARTRVDNWPHTPAK